ncbi:MAG TPA: phage terminase large subunit [Stellaceae bacterium]|jgi:predicted phage terminase large subunit-like protein
MAAAAFYEPDGAQLRAFRASQAFARALIGPVYGGRKTCCIHEIIRRVQDARRQRHWRWLVVGPKADELDREIVPALRDALPPETGWDAKGHRLGLEYNLGDDILRRLEILALGLDQEADRKRFLAAEATAVWLVDARWLAEGVFDTALTIARKSFPAPLQGGAEWSGVICSSRMPGPGHWLIGRSLDAGGVRHDLALFRQPGGRTPEAENLGPLKAAGFSYESLAELWPPDRVRVEIDAELGASAEETALEADREAARNDFTRFIGVVAPDITPAAHHRLLIHTLERVARGELKRVMFFLPPGAAKSTYASLLFPPWFLGRKPADSIILASHQRELAERFGRRVRNIVASAQYRDVFGFGLAPDSGAAGRWETQRGGEFYAVGVDSSVTGRRADLGIIDDPVKGRAEADSPTVRQHTWDWYKADFWTRLKPGAALLYIGTRWHDDDLAGRLIEEAKAGGEQFEIISIPALAKEGDPLGRAPGERLWPEWFTAETFETAQRDVRNWSALYQQEPMPESGDYFKAEWIRWYDKAPPRDELRTYGASDYAVTSDGGDFTVHLVAGVDPEDDIYLLDCWREQTASNEWVEAELDLMARWKTLEWAEEKGQIEKGVGPFLTKRQRERKIYNYRKQYSTAGGDKAVRAQPIRARMAMGKVYFPSRASWATDFVQELLRFPAGRFDDRVDALALIGRMLGEMVPGQRAKRPEPIRGIEALTLDQAYKLTGPGARWGVALVH